MLWVVHYISSRSALTNIGAANHTRYLIINFNENLFPHYNYTWPWLRYWTVQIENIFVLTEDPHGQLYYRGLGWMHTFCISWKFPLMWDHTHVGKWSFQTYPCTVTRQGESHSGFFSWLWFWMWKAPFILCSAGFSNLLWVPGKCYILDLLLQL